MAIKVGMVSLGCSKNQVDAELLLALVVKGGYELSADPAECEVVIINTCGFIEEAKQESINTILEFCQLKEEGTLKAVVVTGCLAERYRLDLAAEIPETDVILGIGRNADIVDAIDRALQGERVVEAAPKELLPLEGDRILSNAPYFAYVKISEGCDNRCTYCAIPMIRGPFRSRKMEDIVAEVEKLIASGVKEINLVAQDTTRYGLDLYGELMLPELMRRICQLPGLVWLRVLYCYPERITDQLLETMAELPQVLPYLDIPIQHCNDRVLHTMNRVGSSESLLQLVQRIRAKLPDVTLRTTLIAGFPGETEEEFDELLCFIQQAKFDRLGCFAYSEEEGTIAATLPGMMDLEERRRRANMAMEAQMQVAFALADSRVGSTLTVLVEGQDWDNEGMWGGRSSMDAPDIDTKVWFTAPDTIQPGDMVQVKITGTEGYDLVGEML